MSDLLPPLPAIRAFEAAARLGNFTRAAEALGMTQAAVSYQIRILEDRVGTPLFQRRARGVALTPEGAHLAARATEALGLLRDAFSDLRRAERETLVISVFASFAAFVLAPRLGHFQLAHPDIAMRIDVNHAVVDLLAGEATIGIRAGTGTWPGLQADKLLQSHFTPMVSRDFAARHGPFTHPRDLIDVPRIDAGDPNWARWFAAAGVATPAPSRGNATFGTQVLEVQAALAGQGASLLTPLYVRDALARGDLIRPFDITADEDVTVWVVYPERRRNAPVIRAFRDWLFAQVAELARG